MLIAIWNMLTNGVYYDDLGGDFYTRRNPDKTKQRALAQLKRVRLVWSDAVGRRFACDSRV